MLGQQSLRSLQEQDYLSCINQTVSNATDIFSEGYNVHIQNGLGNTETANSQENLIIGYNENPLVSKAEVRGKSGRTGQRAKSSRRQLQNVNSKRNGSHNLIVGEGHQYSSYGGLVAGYNNYRKRIFLL
uniref:Uncharacterized protein n=1 Tax=Corethron hystrix TaxID=216773 RepID=A0A7S1BTR4_9STRA|mmetsp:Transcript_38883/g.90465  ORF Transcript_38883/g.90465 Transcript_38883/m.90465 type:complete len:129 (+) Transcript_38883:543-929(+)